ncbi:MAG TPA: hypothetical protein VK476_01025 [Flavobacterium sp.]|nr:hypothetical protein [Flavobacterium sp.]
MKTLLILGIGIWGFLAIVNYYGRPVGERTAKGSDIKSGDNCNDGFSGKKSKVPGMSNPQYS